VFGAKIRTPILIKYKYIKNDKQKKKHSHRV